MGPVNTWMGLKNDAIKKKPMKDLSYQVEIFSICSHRAYVPCFKMSTLQHVTFMSQLKKHEYDMNVTCCNVEIITQCTFVLSEHMLKIST